jgi:hypothetical protein
MPLAKTYTRLLLVTAIFGCLAGCTVAPIYPAGYRSAPVYGNTYPGYGYGGAPSTTIYYQSGSRHHHDGGREYYRHNSPQQQPSRGPSVFEGAARTHREIRRSLGLPRLPGMP